MVVWCFAMAFHTLGKPKELNFQLWLRLSEERPKKFKKDPWRFVAARLRTPTEDSNLGLRLVRNAKKF